MENACEGLEGEGIGEASDCDAGPTPVKGKREGGLGEEPQPAHSSNKVSQPWSPECSCNETHIRQTRPVSGTPTVFSH